MRANTRSPCPYKVEQGFCRYLLDIVADCLNPLADVRPKMYFLGFSALTLSFIPTQPPPPPKEKHTQVELDCGRNESWTPTQTNFQELTQHFTAGANVCVSSETAAALAMAAVPRSRKILKMDCMLSLSVYLKIMCEVKMKNKKTKKKKKKKRKA